jgi:hypothetical protein
MSAAPPPGEECRLRIRSSGVLREWDCSAMATQHPGGAALLRMAASRPDATQLFLDAGHGPSAVRWLFSLPSDEVLGAKNDGPSVTPLAP